MNIKTAFSIALILIAAGLTFWLFIRPVIKPELPIIDESQLIYAGKSESGEAGFYYLEIKEELQDWMKILAPVISFIAAWLLRKKK